VPSIQRQVSRLQQVAALQPRRFAIALICFAFVLLLANYCAAILLQTVSRSVLGGSFAALFCGFWVLLTGKVYPKGKSAPLWWNAGVLACLVAGFGTGIFIVSAVT
jgi:hypothetical protein